MSYIARVFSATSQWFNVLLLNGHPNESISGRSYRQNWTMAVKVINALHFWQNHHCRGAYAKDLEWAKQYITQDEERNAGL
jgi:hypothetical protein